MLPFRDRIPSLSVFAMYAVKGAPTKKILSRYKRDQGWESYQNSFNQLLEQRDIIALWQAQFSDDKRVCLLCSEHEPEQCHRRLVAEYIKHGLPDITVEHLF